METSSDMHTVKPASQEEDQGAKPATRFDMRPIVGGHTVYVHFKFLTHI